MLEKAIKGLEIKSDYSIQLIEAIIKNTENGKPYKWLNRKHV